MTAASTNGFIDQAIVETGVKPARYFEWAGQKLGLPAARIQELFATYCRGEHIIPDDHCIHELSCQVMLGQEKPVFQ